MVIHRSRAGSCTVCLIAHREKSFFKGHHGFLIFSDIHGLYLNIARTVLHAKLMMAFFHIIQYRGRARRYYSHGFAIQHEHAGIAHRHLDASIVLLNDHTGSLGDRLRRLDGSHGYALGKIRLVEKLRVDGRILLAVRDLLNRGTCPIEDFHHIDAWRPEVLQEFPGKYPIAAGTFERRTACARGIHDDAPRRLRRNDRKTTRPRTRPAEGIVPAGIENDDVEAVLRTLQVFQYRLYRHSAHFEIGLFRNPGIGGNEVVDPVRLHAVPCVVKKPHRIRRAGKLLREAADCLFHLDEIRIDEARDLEAQVLESGGHIGGIVAGVLKLSEPCIAAIADNEGIAVWLLGKNSCCTYYKKHEHKRNKERPIAF